MSDAPNDKDQLNPMLGSVSPVIENVAEVLVDSGSFRKAAIAHAEQCPDGTKGPTIYAATGRHPYGRSVERLKKHDDPRAPGPGRSANETMQHRLPTKAGRTLYGQRIQTIEPVFGIIKAAMGFRRFSLRGLKNVRTEWTLVSLSYNLKRLFHLGAKLANG